MTELKLNPNVSEMILNIKGIDIKIKCKDDDKYTICITDPEDRFHDCNLPADYDYMVVNRIHWDSSVPCFWCDGIWCERGSGNVKPTDTFKLEEINIIIEAIENGLAEFERLTRPEIIKVGNVTISKKIISKDKVSLTIDGLIECCDYPDEIFYNSPYIACISFNCMISLYDENSEEVIINYKQYFPTKDFICSPKDANKVIEIITKSEEKLAKYNEEQKKVKVGDTVTYREKQYKLEGTVLDIEDGYACVKTLYGSIYGYGYNKVGIKALKKV